VSVFGVTIITAEDLGQQSIYDSTVVFQWISCKVSWKKENYYRPYVGHRVARMGP